MNPLEKTAKEVMSFGYPRQNLSACALDYMRAKQPEAFAAMSPVDRHFHAGQIANQIRPFTMAAAAPEADTAPTTPKGAPGGAIAKLLGFLTKDFKAAVAAARAENETATLALLEQLVSGAASPSSEGASMVDADGIPMGAPRHLAGVAGPNLSEQARQYLLSKVPGFANHTPMRQHFLAGEYLRQGAPVL